MAILCKDCASDTQWVSTHPSCSHMSANCNYNVTANQTSGQKMSRDQPRLKSRIRFITMNCSELLWITVRWNTVSYYEILWMRSCHLTSAMFSTIWWYVLWQVSGRVALHGMMLSSCSSEGAEPEKAEPAFAQKVIQVTLWETLSGTICCKGNPARFSSSFLTTFRRE